MEQSEEKGEERGQGQARGFEAPVAQIHLRREGFPAPVRLVPITLVATALLAAVVPAAAPGLSGANVPSRDGAVVVLDGAEFPTIAVAPNYVEQPPLPFEDEEMDGVTLPFGVVPGQETGARVEDVRGWRWTGTAFEPIPIQVDERFWRYLTNYASGFSDYSQADAELTYAFDAEGTRKTCEIPGTPWVAAFCPGLVTTADPVSGLDWDDEIAFMARDAGARAPEGATPAGASFLHEVRLADPLDARSEPTFVYVGLAPGAPTSSVRYVAYARDADAEQYVASNHGTYGGAPGGICHPGDGVDDAWGEPFLCEHRRPKDSATVETATYRFHYAGRWKLDGIHLATSEGYTTSLVDRWKGRAFQQKAGNLVDLGGYEDEIDWTRSSVTLGERVGPVRALRETWGSDSGTHVTRLETFTRDTITQTYRVRVHPVPPDGVYAFWDHRAGAVDTYFTPVRPEGVRVDGANDETYGTNSEWQEDALGETWFEIDVPDPALSGVVANELWDQVTGPLGTIVQVLRVDPRGGALLPYYRDDLAFDDGTGHDPPGAQGAFGAHGIHIAVSGDSDNLFLPAPITEFSVDARMHLFPGRLPNVGADVARLDAVPIAATVMPK